MLGTAMNCLAVADVLEQKGVPARVQTALEIKEGAVSGGGRKNASEALWGQ